MEERFRKVLVGISDLVRSRSEVVDIGNRTARWMAELRCYPKEDRVGGMLSPDHLLLLEEVGTEIPTLVGLAGLSDP